MLPPLLAYWRALPRLVRLSVAAGTGFLIAVVAAVIAVPQVRTYGSDLVVRLQERMAGESETTVSFDGKEAAPADPLAAVTERLDEVEKRLQAETENVRQYQENAQALSDQLKAATAEALRTNDQLVKERQQWQQALAKAGVAVSSSSPAVSSTAPAAAGKVNLNTATVAELDTLSGIGPAIAKRIVEYREQKGAFKSPQELLKVEGIGDKLLAKIKDQIAV